MSSWQIEFTDKYERKLRWYEKKQANELLAVLNNLDTYFESLKCAGNPLQVNAGFIHPEPVGIKAIDQKGGNKKIKLKQTRLYIFPCTEEKVLYALTIGNKQSQKEDIKWCQDFVKRIKGGD